MASKRSHVVEVWKTLIVPVVGLAASLRAVTAQAVEIPVTFYSSYRAFDECGWACNAPPPCSSWEYVWVCQRNPGESAGGDVLRFTTLQREILDLSFRIVQGFTAKERLFNVIYTCASNAKYYPNVLLYTDSSGSMPSVQSEDACSGDECVDRGRLDFTHLMYLAQSWPPLSLVPWYESDVNGDTTGKAGAVGFVNEVQRQARFVNARGQSDTLDYPQLWEYWGDHLIINLNLAHLDYMISVSEICWNPLLSGINKYQVCDPDAGIDDISSCKHCAARYYAGTIVHEFMHLMGHQHHILGQENPDSFLHQTFIYTVGDCIRSWGDFAATRNADWSSSLYSFDYEQYFPDEV